MKLKNILAIVALLCAVSAVSFYLGTKQSTVHYEAACHMSDALRSFADNLEEMRREDPNNFTLAEVENTFEEAEGIFLYDDAVANPVVNLEEYVWAY